MPKCKIIKFTTTNTIAVCVTCNGTGWYYEDGTRHFCPTCGGTGEVEY